MPGQRAHISLLVCVLVNDGRQCRPARSERLLPGKRVLQCRVTLVRPAPDVADGCTFGGVLDEDRGFADDVDDKLGRVTAWSAAGGECE